MAEPMGAFNRDPTDLVVTTRDRLVVNHLLKHFFLSQVELKSLLEDLERVPLTKKAHIFNENPPVLGRPKDSRARYTVLATMGVAATRSTNPTRCTSCLS